MKLAFYIPELHECEIRSWLRSRDLEFLIHEFPKRTYIVIDKNPIAIGGLDVGEKTASLVCVTTNPNATARLRSRGIDLLFKKIIEDAKNLGFKFILGWANNRGMIEKSKKYGFKQTNQTMMGLDLREAYEFN